MQYTLPKQVRHEAVSLLTDITFTNVPSWYGASRTDLKMDLLVPKVRTPEKKLPAMLWFCGGSFRMMDKSVWLPELMYFARHGFVVASAAYRTSNACTFPEPLMDAKAAVRFLRAHASDFCIDPDCIIAMGESAGGALAALLGVTAGRPELEVGDHLDTSSAVQAVVQYYGLNDMAIDSFPITDATPPWMLADLLGANYTRETAKSASAVQHVDAAAPPMLLLRGSEDEILGREQTLSLYDRLVAAGVRTDMIEIEGAVHGDDAFYQDEIGARVVHFLREVLPR